MTPVIRFKADDGAIFECQDEAIERDRLLAGIEVAMLPLGSPVRCSGGDQYRQHRPEAVDTVKRRLIALTRPYLREMEKWPDPMLVPPVNFCRMLEYSCSPLQRAWTRLWCIDSQCREWSQPYFAMNPEPTAVAV
jgi:hypothetical protein